MKSLKEIAGGLTRRSEPPVVASTRKPRGVHPTDLILPSTHTELWDPAQELRFLRRVRVAAGNHWFLKGSRVYMKMPPARWVYSVYVKVVSRRHVVYAKCGEALCLNPLHLSVRRFGAHGDWDSALGRVAKKIQIPVSIYPEQLNQIEALAEERNENRNTTVRDLLDCGLRAAHGQDYVALILAILQNENMAKECFALLEKQPDAAP